MGINANRSRGATPWTQPRSIGEELKLEKLAALEQLPIITGAVMAQFSRTSSVGDVEWVVLLARCD